MFFSSTTLHSGCKVNIFLEIRELRNDGYHNLRTLFFPLPEPHDTMVITAGQQGASLSLTCLGRKIDNDDNILLRAYKLFSQRTGLTPDLEIRLTKRIPIGAGLGGGSSNAAAFLLFLNRLATAISLNDVDLHSLAATVGADVPFFLTNRPAWAEGIGDILRPADISLAGFYSVLVCPEIQISTAWAYRAWDETQTILSPRRPSQLTACGLQDILTTCPNAFFYNSFEQVVFPAYPHLRKIKERLLEHGAAGAVLSGSGASIIAIFRDPRDQERASRWIKQANLDHYKHSFE
jgi:4-diphosphocytidyl-2-C-methyl-D-erythritol kinase